MVLDTPAPNKGYSNSATLSQDMADREEADKVLLGVHPSRVRRDDFSRQMSLLTKWITGKWQRWTG